MRRKWASRYANAWRRPPWRRPATGTAPHSARRRSRATFASRAARAAARGSNGDAGGPPAIRRRVPPPPAGCRPRDPRLRGRAPAQVLCTLRLVVTLDLGAPIGTPPEQLGGFAASPTADEMRTAARELSSACCSTKAMLAHYAAARGISLEGALSSVLLPKAAVVPARPTEHEASANESAPPHASQRRAARRQLVWGGIDLIRSDGTSRVSRHDHVGGV